VPFIYLDKYLNTLLYLYKLFINNVLPYIYRFNNSLFMTLSPYSIPKNIWLAALIAITIVLGGQFLVHQIPLAKRDAVATGFLLDMVITFPVIYYFLVIRPLKLRKWSIMLVITLCCVVAYVILPEHQRSYIIQLRKLTVLIELGALIYGIGKIRKVRAAYRQLQTAFPDTAYNLYKSMAIVFGDGIYVKIVASELTILRFGLLCWKKTKQVPVANNPYTVYKESGYPALFGMILFACAVEITGLHLLLLHYSKTAALIVSILSVYGTIFIVSDLSAILKSPVLIMGDQLLLRTGLRWRAMVNKNNVASIEKIKDSFQPDAACFKGGVMKSSVNVLITFKHPVSVERLYREQAMVSQIMMSIDKADDFIMELKG
jgi:hypothetical protein